MVGTGSHFGCVTVVAVPANKKARVCGPGFLCKVKQLS